MKAYLFIDDTYWKVIRIPQPLPIIKVVIHKPLRVVPQPGNWNAPAENEPEIFEFELYSQIGIGEYNYLYKRRR